MRLFGLTGGVASGKSAVAARFRERGMAVIDADALARQVVEPGTEGLAEVVTAFGADMLAPDGTLDRKALGALVFGDDVARNKLNAILHPRIREATMARARELEAEGATLACYEAALLVENGLADAFRPLVVVAASSEVQRQRIIQRDGLDEAQAEARIAAQLPLADKVSVADYVIDNDGDRAALIQKADWVLDEIVARYAETPSG